MEHVGRHPNAYHNYMLQEIQRIDKIANGNQQIFLRQFDTLKQEVLDNPDMLRKYYWGQ